MLIEYSIAGLFWIYLAEVCTDQQMGFVTLILYLGGVELSLITEYLVHWLQPEGMILLFAGFSGVGCIFLCMFLKETSGLTDRQKKELYLPKSIKENENNE